MVGALAGRNFGMALVGLGLLILTLGIVGHVRFMLDLRREHDALVEERLIPHDRLPYSVRLAVAVLLWLAGLTAIISMVTRLGPLG